MKKPAQYADSTPLPKQYQPRVLVPQGNQAIDVTDTQLPANGSVGKISFEARENSYGTFAKLRNVLVTEMIEYKKGGGSAGNDFGLEFQGASDFDTPEQPVTKQPKPVTVPDNVDAEESLPF